MLNCTTPGLQTITIQNMNPVTWNKLPTASVTVYPRIPNLSRSWYISQIKKPIFVLIVDSTYQQSVNSNFNASIYGTNLISSVSDVSKLECLSRCNQLTSCLSASYSYITRVCALFNTAAAAAADSITYSASVDLFYKTVGNILKTFS